MQEKTDRNTQIYLEKYGFASVNDAKEGKSTLVPLTYRQLFVKYNLSFTRLQTLIEREHEKLKLK